MSGITNGRREILTATVYLVRMEVAILKRTDGVTPCFDNLSGSHLLSQGKSSRQMMVFMPVVVDFDCNF